MMRSRFALAVVLCALLVVALAPMHAHASPLAPTRALSWSTAILGQCGGPYYAQKTNNTYVWTNLCNAGTQSTPGSVNMSQDLMDWCSSGGCSTWAVSAISDVEDPSGRAGYVIYDIYIWVQGQDACSPSTSWTIDMDEQGNTYSTWDNVQPWVWGQFQNCSGGHPEATWAVHQFQNSTGDAKLIEYTCSSPDFGTQNGYSCSVR